MTKTENSGVRLSGRSKFLVDFGPLLIFMAGYFLGGRLAPKVGAVLGRDWAIAEGEEMFLAVSAFLPAFFIAFVYSVWKERRVAPMLAISGVAVGVLGTLTLVFHNKTFFYMKPTIVYLLFSITLAGGLVAKQNFLKTVFDGALQMDEEPWRVLTKRFAVFFFALAVANEVAWRWLMRDCDIMAAVRCPGEPHWINLKVWGFTIVNFIFIAFQAPFISKHMNETPENAQ
ncbi:MAG: inner membrane-spanning protein YciB [Pseudomonadota bacterium]